LIAGTVFLIEVHFLKKLIHPKNHQRATILLLVTFVVIPIVIFGTQAYYASDFRYINAVIPFLSEQTSFTATVSEHSKPTLVDYFTNYSILLIFAGLGAWRTFNQRDYLSVFALILGITSVYVSAGLIRLLVYASVGIIVLSSIGLYQITHNIMQIKKESSPMSAISNNRMAATGAPSTTIPPYYMQLPAPKARKVHTKTFGGLFATIRSIKILYAVLIILAFSFPLFYPSGLSWKTSADFPPTILNGGTGSTFHSLDWIDSLNWMSKNIPENSVIAAWWDYGYWITTLSNRTTLADNATFNQTRIATIAKMFMEKPLEGVNLASSHLRANYILVYVVAEPISIGNNTYYLLGYGGDESKVPVFVTMAGLDERVYINRNQYTPIFWDATLIGKLIPFTPAGYTSFDDDNKPANLFQEYKPDTIPVYSKNIKYPSNTNSAAVKEPLSLAYASDSFAQNSQGIISAVLIYKINIR
jgi:dolichyl-diphosphooligosaccharide--protein glycosyltransferase